jgi:hypothetical protein
MSLPFQFANVTTLVTGQLDANYNALGALTPVPCTVAGTNTITMSLNASTPTVASFSNYMQFTGIVAATNTTTVTIAVGGLGALPAYKDTQAGPVALTGQELIQNCQFTAIYDSSLNAGGGGFHVSTTGSRISTSGGTITGPILFTGPVQVGVAGNTTLSNVVSAAASIGWPNIGATTSTVATLAVAGSSVGDCVFLSTPASVPAGITFFGWVPNAGTVTIQALNVTGASITPVAGTYRATAQRYTP